MPILALRTKAWHYELKAHRELKAKESCALWYLEMVAAHSCRLKVPWSPEMLHSIADKIRNRLSGCLFQLVHRDGGRFASPPVIRGLWPKIFNQGSMAFGPKCVFRSFRLRPQIAVLSGAVLDVGVDAFMNDGINICAAQSIKIGRSVKIGDMVYIYDTDFHAIAPDRPVRKKPIVIGDNVWIGSNSMILAGAQIGDHAVIAAGSVVTGEIPPRSVAAGSPARVISTFAAPDDWVRA